MGACLLQMMQMIAKLLNGQPNMHKTTKDMPINIYGEKNIKRVFLSTANLTECKLLMEFW